MANKEQKDAFSDAQKSGDQVKDGAAETQAPQNDGQPNVTSDARPPGSGANVTYAPEDAGVDAQKKEQDALRASQPERAPVAEQVQDKDVQKMQIVQPTQNSEIHHSGAPADAVGGVTASPNDVPVPDPAKAGDTSVVIGKTSAANSPRQF